MAEIAGWVFVFEVEERKKESLSITSKDQPRENTPTQPQIHPF